jgi:four helix bundle protein
MNLSHEKLIVYQRSLDFLEFVHKVIVFETNRINAIDQLDRVATFIPLNIAEGTGKYTGKDKCRFYDIARG